MAERGKAGSWQFSDKQQGVATIIMNTGALIQDSVLDDRSEHQRIRDALLRTQGQLTVEDAQFAQSVWREIELFLASGQQPPPVLLPEITSARPGESQTFFIEELTRLCTEMLKRINTIPNKVNIRLLQLLNTFVIPARWRVRL
ncbi:MAG: hypothetical protein ACREDR_26010 [Blastocatellia bacterium]